MILKSMNIFEEVLFDIFLSNPFVLQALLGNGQEMFQRRPDNDDISEKVRHYSLSTV